MVLRFQSMRIMEHRIGTTITLSDGRKAKVVESKSTCKGCVFDEYDDYNCYCGCYMCGRKKRTDHKDVIYKEVKD